jgi:uncharacterized membrane protein HdeD (DUF308 family)
MVNADHSDRSANLTEPGSEQGRLVSRVWWIFLMVGICLVILGAWTLARSPESIRTLARIAGLAFFVDALLLCLLAARAEEWRGFYLLGALTGLAGVALVLIKGLEPLQLALVLTAVLTLRGLIDSLVAWGGITDFVDASRPLWAWVFLAVGIGNFVLGVFALIFRDGSLFALMVIVGGLAVARGIGMLAISSRLRALS